MRRFIFASMALLVVGLAFLLYHFQHNTPKKSKYQPVDWFYQQRAYPTGNLNRQAYQESIQQAQKLRQQPQKSQGEWFFAGPYNIGGRLTDVELDPSNEEHIYLGTASGGIFKSVDAGSTFSPLFDEQPSLSIGDIAISPSNAQVVYVGTGEANPGGGSLAYDGLGIYRSDDAGQTWQQRGLQQSGSVGRIVVHPQNADVAYVAAMGYLFENNSQRGVFKTTDGGQNWSQVLYSNDSTGAIDLAMHPQNPDTIYAVMWERVRRLSYFTYGGFGSGIFRSYDGGITWQELTNGLPGGVNVGRIGIGISQSQPNIMYAIYSDRTGYFSGLFRSEDGGDSWTQTNDSSLDNIYASYGWWFGRLKIDPQDAQKVYAIGLDLFKTTDGGQNWDYITGSAHVDMHEVAVSPTNSSRMYLGNDGGFYISDNGGNSWSHNTTLPITQFYTAAIEATAPFRLYGGTQDNGTNRTLSGNPYAWAMIYGGDGFYCLVDYNDADYVYAEYQYGNLARSINHGTTFTPATTGISSNDRKNWNTPVVMNPINSSSLYYGSHRLYKTVNKAVNWQAISDDLTNGPGGGNQKYGTITTIHVSPVDTNVIYVGTDDANVWVTQNQGADWTKISAELPRRWISRVVADPVEVATAYVCLSGFRENEYMPHIFKTEDFGATWQDISAGLPEAPVNDLVVWPDVMKRLIAATDVGVFYKDDGFDGWYLLAEGLPLVPITDLALDFTSGTLAAATYGRSMYTITMTVGNDELSVENEAEIRVYPIPATDYLMVELPNGIEQTQWSLVQLDGKELQSGLLSGENKIDLRKFSPPKGVYLLKVWNGSWRQTCKVILE